MNKVNLAYLDTKEKPEESSKLMIFTFEMLPQDSMPRKSQSTYENKKNDSHIT